MKTATTLLDEIDEIMPGVIADRRHLHAHPELGFEENETARFVAERLATLGVEEVRTGMGGTGVTGLIRGVGTGPGKERVVRVRADMDALPILEENEVEYASTTPGVMHACGHDAHTAMLLGLARVLTGRRETFAGTVKVAFQPAEELPPGGAIAMIEDGVLDNPRVDAAFGLHVASELPAGMIGLRAGPAMASGDLFTIRVHGTGGHGAHPDQAVDPIVIGSQIVTALQTLISRESDPVATGVVSVTAFRAGEAFNVIPDAAELRGAMRTLSDEVRETIERRMGAMVGDIAAALGGSAAVTITRGYPSLVNDAALCRIVRDVAVKTVGAERVIDMPPVMGGEDFARFGREVPSMFFFVGVRNEAHSITWPNHHPRFDIDEEGLAPGIATMAGAILAYLEHGIA